MQKLLEVKEITKIYKIYRSNFDRLKEVFTEKRYHKAFVANESISFDLFEGETLGIIGVNGAGKSTILKIIAGVIDPTQGEVLAHGRVTALLELGTGFNPQLSGYDNIYLNGTLIGMTKKEIDENITKIIEFSELNEFIYEELSTYSSGMSMRLAFSIALFSRPQILIVDEALSVGDAHFAAKCTEALKERKKENMSIIYVSHDLNSLKILCDRVMLLNKGKMVEIGEPESVINHYNYLIAKLDKGESTQIQKTANAFGTFDLEIEKVSLKGLESKSNLVSSGEDVSIEIVIQSKKSMTNMTVGILIRDKYGQDIFGTNTYHHNLELSFEKDNRYRCSFKMPLNIGTGKYSLTVAIHSNETHLQNCSHWLDYAVDFEVAGIKGAYFIGLCKLEPKIDFDRINKESGKKI